MDDSQPIGRLIEKHCLAGIDRIAGPDRKLYRAFGLKRGGPWQLFGPKVWVRGLLAAVLGGHGIGRPSAGSFQMPGLFFIHASGIIRRFRHRTAAGRPDYAGICARTSL
jgi:hypothetical protein